MLGMGCDLVDYSSVRADAAIEEPSGGLFKILVENHRDYPTKLCWYPRLGALSKIERMIQTDVYNPGIVDKILAYVLINEVKTTTRLCRVWNAGKTCP